MPPSLFHPWTNILKTTHGFFLSGSFLTGPSENYNSNTHYHPQSFQMIFMFLNHYFSGVNRCWATELSKSEKKKWCVVLNVDRWRSAVGFCCENGKWWWMQRKLHCMADTAPTACTPHCGTLSLPLRPPRCTREHLRGSFLPYNSTDFISKSPPHFVSLAVERHQNLLLNAQKGYSNSVIVLVTIHSIHGRRID